MNVKKKMKTHI